MPILILASKSPRRVALLKKEGLKFKIIPANIEENSRFRRPGNLVADLARQKASFVAEKNPESPVLAADTVVYVKGRILGKPAGKSDALRLLRLQNGRRQTVFTGVCLIWKAKGINLCETAKSFCYARKLSEKELKELSGKHLDKAGAYAVQDESDYFIERIEGDFDNVVGLPMRIVRKFLKKIKYS